MLSSALKMEATLGGWQLGELCLYNENISDLPQSRHASHYSVSPCQPQFTHPLLFPPFALASVLFTCFLQCGSNRWYCLGRAALNV